MDPVKSLLEPVIAIAKEAGEQILSVYEQSHDLILEVKKDGTPLTSADQDANDIITAGLKKLTPELPILSEESTDVPFSERAKWQRYWLVDPLDGTKEFLQRTGDFTVNIALIDGHHPIMGVVYVPTTKLCYFACKNFGAYKLSEDNIRERLHTSECNGDHVRIVSSRRHGVEELKPFLEKIKAYEMLLMGSSLKFCVVAEGNADIYPRFGLTSEWDTAAAQCIVEQAGGAVIDVYGLPLRYNTRDSLLNPHFLVIGDPSHQWILYLAVHGTQ